MSLVKLIKADDFQDDVMRMIKEDKLSKKLAEKLVLYLNVNKVGKIKVYICNWPEIEVREIVIISSIRVFAYRY